MTSSLHNHYTSLLAYDKATGVLTWKVSINPRAPKGSRAGTVRPDGRRQVRIGRRLYLEHRLIWFLVTGTWPDPEVDHRNRKFDDNRWRNLRVATREQNTANHGGKRHKASGLPVGVYRERSKFRACLSKNGRQIRVGVYDSVESAVEARRLASLKLNGDFAPEALI